MKTLELQDVRANTAISVATDTGLTITSMIVSGHEIVYFPGTVEAYRESGGLAGFPFLYPWANRLYSRKSGTTHSKEPLAIACGKRSIIIPQKGEPGVLFDGNDIAIHGLLTRESAWETIDYTKLASDLKPATASFSWKSTPESMKFFPYSHRVVVTYELRGTELTVRTLVSNDDTEPMPASWGYHPYFQLPVANRDDVFLEIPAKKGLILDDKMLPTGEFFDVSEKWPSADRMVLNGHKFDTGFSEFPAGSVFAVEDPEKRIEVKYIKNYSVAVIYAPPGEPFVCIEPMIARTNAIATSHAPAIAPGESLEAVYSVSVKIKQ